MGIFSMEHLPDRWPKFVAAESGYVIHPGLGSVRKNSCRGRLYASVTSALRRQPYGRGPNRRLLSALDCAASSPISAWPGLTERKSSQKPLSKYASAIAASQIRSTGAVGRAADGGRV